jgi:hypothetical protein
MEEITDDYFKDKAPEAVDRAKRCARPARVS